MKKLCIVALAATVLAFSSFARAADTEKALQDASAKAKNALAVLTYKIALETGDQASGGQAVCINAESGLFMTTAIDPNVKASMLKDILLTPPGADAKGIKATFEGLDPISGLGFFKVEGKNTFSAVEFNPAPALTVGQQVVSVGILLGDGARTPYLGVGYVSAMLRVPGKLVYVTGGKLTNIGSVIFGADGKAIGIVGRQIPLSYSTPMQQGMASLPLRGEDETSFFTPADEFASILKNPPKGGEVRPLAWLGINKFDAVTEANAEARGIKLPAIMVDDVIPNQPADKAGLMKSDIITKVNGKEIEKLSTSEMTIQNFMAGMMKLQAGDKVALSVIRTGDDKKSETKEITITAGPMPDLPEKAPRIYDQVLGLVAREKVMLDQYLDTRPSGKTDGLLIAGIAQRSPADLGGLIAGDVITQINDKAVKVVADYKAIVEPAVKNGDKVKFTVFRNNQLNNFFVQGPAKAP